MKKIKLTLEDIARIATKIVEEKKFDIKSKTTITPSGKKFTVHYDEDEDDEKKFDIKSKTTTTPSGKKFTVHYDDEVNETKKIKLSESQLIKIVNKVIKEERYIRDEYKDNREEPHPLVHKLENDLPLTKWDLYVDGDLDLNFLRVKRDDRKQIKELPDGLRVEGHLDIRLTDIETLPPDLYIGKNLWAGSTPLAKKYSREEIHSMINYIGGKVIT